MSGALKRLMLTDTSPEGPLLQADGPLAAAAQWATAFRQAGRTPGVAARAGTLERGLREVLSYLVIFHWNRSGLPKAFLPGRPAPSPSVTPIPGTPHEHALPFPAHCQRPHRPEPHADLAIQVVRSLRAADRYTFSPTASPLPAIRRDVAHAAPSPVGRQAPREERPRGLTPLPPPARGERVPLDRGAR
ncbi:hypothetical protein ALI22I_02320 [Saccharothrix sp. ALI-22-I]|nr:hypothetical protein ALI22I_02320 [Saccharothrix sp. ALI-22-I]